MEELTAMPHHVEAMMDAYPAEINMDRSLLVRCVEACGNCSQTCTACADSCLSEEMVAELRKCIRTCLDCADTCEVTGRILSRHTGYDANLTRTVLQACAQACKSCGDECQSHAQMHEHCRICAETCRDCEKACQDVLQAVG
jgi:hypothetical protein